LKEWIKFSRAIIRFMKDEVIEINPEKVSGTPVFAGTRVPIQNLFDYIEGGETLEDFLEGFPPVTRQQAVAVLEQAKDSLFKEAAKN
jgi:uncharacterized protein (DUF433 family)